MRFLILLFCNKDSWKDGGFKYPLLHTIQYCNTINVGLGKSWIQYISELPTAVLILLNSETVAKKEIVSS